MSKSTQAQRVLEYIEQFGSITQIDAIQDLGVMRLAARIADLRQLGYSICSTTETVKNRYGDTCYVKRYFLHFEEGEAVEG
ncbi:helix-turn-helix domain-containing protein [Pseudoflavonifractor sp. An85]|uniref:helix-turn-helix domain-containing protein n=1 Tax=Pseudoflavonifractor sp. An85 TaxID=1965661 RepID=UPI001302823B|nr:helix-turn-helix domain-containing protein [Pseudoflavonifractor sp. An85]